MIIARNFFGSYEREKRGRGVVVVSRSSRSNDKRASSFHARTSHGFTRIIVAICGLLREESIESNRGLVIIRLC